MRNLIFLFILLFFVLFKVAAYAETTIKAQVNKAKITTDEPLIYKIVISSDGKILPALELPKFENFSIASQGQSSSISFNMGKIITSLSYELILVPLKIGKITINPSQIKIGSQVYKSQSFEIEVSQGKNKLKIQPKSKSHSPNSVIPESEKQAEEVTL